MYNVAILVGSVRRESINRKLAEALVRLGLDRLAMEIVEIGDHPMYDDDLWEAVPQSVLRLKAQIEAAHAVIQATPEYNRSIPPVLKNAIDWASRPYGRSSWTGKPGSIVGASPGAIGTAAAQTHLRNIAAVVGIALMGQPEVQLSYLPGMIDDDGEVTDPATRAFLSSYIGQFAAWIDRLTPADRP